MYFLRSVSQVIPEFLGTIQLLIESVTYSSGDTLKCINEALSRKSMSLIYKTY